MKRTALILILCLILSPAALAEASHADDFIDGLTHAWNGLVGMTQDAADGVSAWADESGVTAWVQGAVSDVAAWADANGVTAWAQGALNDLSAWADDSGFNEWAQNVSQQVQAIIDENGPAVEAWLKSAGEEVNRAWDTLTHAERHTEEEVKDALETVAEAGVPTAEPVQ